jgi:hypothetical protein
LWQRKREKKNVFVQKKPPVKKKGHKKNLVGFFVTVSADALLSTMHHTLDSATIAWSNTDA